MTGRVRVTKSTTITLDACTVDVEALVQALSEVAARDSKAVVSIDVHHGGQLDPSYATLTIIEGVSS